MNVNQLRKGYANLSKLQRLALFDQAIGRDDDSEAEAVVAASPRVNFSQADFGDLYNNISRLRLCNLLFRFGCLVRFGFLLQAALRAAKLETDSAFDEFYYEIKLAGFLYVRDTDSWQALNDELGLQPDYEGAIAQVLISREFLGSLDSVLREIAFTEVEASAYLLERYGTAGVGTIEQAKAGYRAALGL